MATPINLFFGDMDGGYPNAANGSTSAITNDSNTFFLDAGKNASYGDMEVYDLQTSILPVDATITGIEVRILNSGYSGGSAGSSTFDCEIFHGIDSQYSNTISTEVDNLQTSPEEIVIGDSTQLWGKTWTKADFYHSSFKVHFDNMVENGPQIGLVGTFIYMRVYYEASTSGLLKLDSGLVQLNSGLITI